MRGPRAAQRRRDQPLPGPETARPRPARTPQPRPPRPTARSHLAARPWPGLPIAFSRAGLLLAPNDPRTVMRPSAHPIPPGAATPRPPAQDSSAPTTIVSTDEPIIKTRIPSLEANRTPVRPRGSLGNWHSFDTLSSKLAHLPQRFRGNQAGELCGEGRRQPLEAVPLLRQRGERLLNEPASSSSRSSGSGGGADAWTLIGHARRPGLPSAARIAALGSVAFAGAANVDRVLLHVSLDG
jgi:hypothetical protein